jgi:hypothetical protein
MRPTLNKPARPRTAGWADLDAFLFRSDPTNLARSLAAAMGSRRSLAEALAAALSAFGSVDALAEALEPRLKEQRELANALQRGTYGDRLSDSLRSTELIKKAITRKNAILRRVKQRLALPRQEPRKRSSDFALGFAVSISATRAQLAPLRNGPRTTGLDTAFLRLSRHFLTPPQARPVGWNTADPTVRKSHFLRLFFNTARALAINGALPDRVVVYRHPDVRVYMAAHYLYKPCVNKWLNDVNYPRSSRGNPNPRGISGQFATD